MEKILHFLARLIKVHNIRKFVLFATLTIVATLAVLGYTYDWGAYSYGPQYDSYDYDSYPYDAGDGYCYSPYEGYNYYGPGYEGHCCSAYGYDGYYIYDAGPGYGDEPTYVEAQMVTLGGEYVYLWDFDVHSYELGLFAYGEYLYRIDEDMEAFRIGPRMGITVIFNAMGGEYNIGNDIRVTQLGDATVGQIGYAPLVGMPPAPSGVGMRIFMGWNTQPDGLGTAFTGTTDVHAINSPLTVYAQWGFQVLFLGAGIPAGGTGPADPNYYGPRVIREGWSFTQQAANWPLTHNVAWPNPLPNLGAFAFQGWYNSPVGGIPWNANMTVNSVVGLHSRWPGALQFRVDFNMQGGVLGDNPTSPPAPLPGLVQTLHRYVRPGTSINFSGHPPAIYGLPSFNMAMANRRSAPTVLYPTGEKTLEGWWMEPGGWDAAGNVRFSSPGSPEDGSGTILPIPAAFSDTPVNENIEVHAHWVHRVTFNPSSGGGGGLRHPLPPVPLSPTPSPDDTGHQHYFYNARFFSASWTFGPTGALPLFRDIRVADAGMPIESHGLQRNVFTDEPEDRWCVPDATYVHRAGHTFNGWWILDYASVNSGTFFPNANANWPTTVGAIRFDETNPVHRSKTVFAHWVPADNIYVTFDAGEGHFYRNQSGGGTYPPVLFESNIHVIRMAASPGNPGTINAATCGPNCPGQPNQPPGSGHAASRSITMPTHPRREGFVFIGWFDWPCPYPAVPPAATPRNLTTSFLAGTTSTVDRTVYAHWARYVTVIFDPNGGYAPPPGPPVGPPPGTPGAPAPAHPGASGQPNALPAGSNAPYRRLPVGYWNVGVPMHMFNFNNFTGSAGVVNGMVIYRTTTYSAFGITRPGFVTMPAQWQWPWFDNNLNGGHGGAIWNTNPLGTGHVFAQNTHTNFLLSLADNNRELRVYLQWGLNVTFDPNTASIGVPPTAIVAPSGSPHNDDWYWLRIFGHVGSPGFPQGTMTALAANYSFNTRLRTYTGPASPPTLPHSIFIPQSWSGGHHHTIPYYPGFWPNHPMANNLTFTQRFPDPCQGGNWPAVATAVAGSDAAFLGWNTCPNATGAWLLPSTIVCSILPLRNEAGQVVVGPNNMSTLYGIWDTTSISFSCGEPCPGHGIGGCDPDLCQPPFRIVPPTRIPFTPGVTTWAEIPWPPNPTPRPDMDVVFVGWQLSMSDGSEGWRLTDALRNSTEAIPMPVSFHFYARWGIPVFFDTNGGVFSGGATMAQRDAELALPIPQTQLDSATGGVGIPTRGAGTQAWRFGRWNTQRDGLSTPIIGSSLSPPVAGSPPVQDIPEYAGNDDFRTVFAQWDGLFYFDLAGGQINGSTDNPVVWVPENFTISEANLDATNSLPASLPPSPAPNHNISNRAEVPDNPVHASDPSLVFVGWRIYYPWAINTGYVLNRTQVANEIRMNGILNPDDDSCNLTNAPSGEIILEAVWHQRLIFTKTGEEVCPTTQRIESLYLTYPDFDDDSRRRFPRDNAEFRLERMEFDEDLLDFVWIPIYCNSLLPTGPGYLVSGNNGNPVPAYGSPTGDGPFSPQLPAQTGRVATRAPLVWNTIYRLTEVLPPEGYRREGIEGGEWRWYISTIANWGERSLGRANLNSGFYNEAPIEAYNEHAIPYDGAAGVSGIVPMFNPFFDTRISFIEPFYHDLYFVDWHSLPSDDDPPEGQRWYVGNRRPRLNFLKKDRDNEPQDGVVFVVERRERDNVITPWDDDDWAVIYTTEPSGSVAIPLLPAQPPPFPMPTPIPGMVVITRPIFTANANPLAATATVQYRLRETVVPSGYIIPLGYWMIATNRYSGVVDFIPGTTATGNIVPGFGYDPLSPTPPEATYGIPSPVHPRPWDVYWELQNVPVRYWPFLKTDGQIITSVFDHSYLEGAVFKLFYYKGDGDPGDRMVMPTDIFGNDPLSPWGYVLTQESSDSREPMWFPMMPGRHYQMVEVFAPAGYTLPWGQWRFRVLGADINNMAGTELHYSVVGHGTPEVVRRNIPIHCQHITGRASYYHPCGSDNCAGCYIQMDVYHIPNLPDLYLPLTGGTGLPLAITAAGALLFGLSFVVLFLKAKPGRTGD